MPNPKKLFPQKSELPADVLAKDVTVQLLNRELASGNFVRNLGLNLTKEGDKVPESNGVPRVFLFRDGKLSSLEESKMEMGSRDFWRAAAMGHVFAYPAGEKLPVQVQLSKFEQSTPDLTFSAPLDPQKLPQVEMGPEPRKPRWYHRVFRFGENRKICQEYDRYLAEKERQPELAKACAEAVRNAYGNKRIDTSLHAEKQEEGYLREVTAEQKKQKRLRSELVRKQADLGKEQQAIDTAESVYGPAPKKLPGMTGKVYSEKQFELLKPIDLNGAAVGGKAVTDREFTALALFAGADPKIAAEAQKIAGDPEPVFSAFEAAGYSWEESGEIISESGREMYGRSLMDRRADTGNYFESAVKPAREKAKEALDAYQGGDKGPLADILARMVGHIGREATSRHALTDSFYAQNQLAGEMLDLMDRDPALKKMTEQKYEQHEQAFHQRHPQFLKPPSFAEQTESIRQVQELNKLRTKSMKAKSALLDARLKDKDLANDVKQVYARDILKYNLISHMYTAEVNMADSTSAVNPRNGAYMALGAQVAELPGPANGIGSAKGGSTAPVSPKVIMRDGMVSRTIPKPEILSHVASPKMMAELDEGLDKLIQTDGLDRLSSDELCSSLVMLGPDDNEYTGSALMDKIIDANIPPQEQPPETGVREKDIQKAQNDLAVEKEEEQQQADQQILP